MAQGQPAHLSLPSAGPALGPAELLPSGQLAGNVKFEAGVGIFYICLGFWNHGGDRNGA